MTDPDHFNTEKVHDQFDDSSRICGVYRTTHTISPPDLSENTTMNNYKKLYIDESDIPDSQSNESDYLITVEFSLSFNNEPENSNFFNNPYTVQI